MFYVRRFYYPICFLFLMEEIRRSPVDMVNLSHDLQGFLPPSQVVGNGISEPSTVCVLFHKPSQDLTSRHGWTRHGFELRVERIRAYDNFTGISMISWNIVQYHMMWLEIKWYDPWMNLPLGYIYIWLCNCLFFNSIFFQQGCDLGSSFFSRQQSGRDGTTSSRFGDARVSSCWDDETSLRSAGLMIRAYEALVSLNKAGY